MLDCLMTMVLRVSRCGSSSAFSDASSARLSSDMIFPPIWVADTASLRISAKARGRLLDQCAACTTGTPCTGPGCSARYPNGLALGRFSVIYATPPCVITPRSPVQASCAVLEHLWLTRPYVPKARTLRPGVPAVADTQHRF